MTKPALQLKVAEEGNLRLLEKETEPLVGAEIASQRIALHIGAWLLYLPLSPAHVRDVEPTRLYPGLQVYLAVEGNVELVTETLPFVGLDKLSHGRGEHDAVLPEKLPSTRQEREAEPESTKPKLQEWVAVAGKRPPLVTDILPFERDRDWQATPKRAWSARFLIIYTYQGRCRQKIRRNRCGRIQNYSHHSYHSLQCLSQT